MAQENQTWKVHGYDTALRDFGGTPNYRANLPVRLAAMIGPKHGE